MSDHDHNILVNSKTYIVRILELYDKFNEERLELDPVREETAKYSKDTVDNLVDYLESFIASRLGLHTLIGVQVVFSELIF